MDNLSPNTAAAYGRIIRRAGIVPPATPKQVAAYIDGLVAAGRRRQTVRQHLAAIARQHHTLGFAFDTRHPLIKEAAERSKLAPKRRPDPMVELEGHGFLPEQDARDHLLIYLHGVCGLTMEAIVGLDWQQVGEGTGVMYTAWNGSSHLSLSNGGITAKILRVDVVESAYAWARFAGLEPGDPVFREIKNHRGKATVSRRRLTPHGFRWMLGNRRERR